MSTPQVCPECGAGLPANAPGGLCPKCLLAAAVAFDGADRETLYGHSSAATTELAAPAVPVDLDRFRREVLELGLIPTGEFERFVAGALGGVQGLAKALVLAGKLTPYQAGALAQGKARGLVIGNYFVLDKLGAGGMGVVFKARHRRLGRVVALKILPPSLARNRDLLTRFRREVDVAAKLSHPNIVSVLDADEDRGVQFMTMEYIKGNDLDRLVRDGGVLPVDLALACTIQAARGLEAAHAQGIVHRDIKPGNLMLDESGVVRVLDLGLARLIEAANPFAETTTGPLTRSGTYMGTVDFMAPEQGVDSRLVDHRADIYSLGCTLCYLLTGRPPFDGANVLARLMAHQERPAASLLAARPDVPKTIDAVYQKMMAKKPAERFASMTEVVTRLEACRSSSIETEEARSGLKMFAESVVLKRAAPKGTIRDSSVFKRDEQPVLSFGPDARLEDVLFEYREEKPPVAPTVVSEPAPHPKPLAARPRKRAKSRSPLFALGAVALLTLGGLGYAVVTRKPDTSADNRGGNKVSPGGTEGARDAATPPSGSAPFRIGSVWANPTKRLRLEVLERDDRSFKARFTAGDSLREVRGKIEGNRITWMATDARVIRGSVGADNQGTIQGNTIDLSWNGRSPGSTTLAAERPASESPGAVASGSTFDVTTCYTTNFQAQSWTALAATEDGRRAFIGGRTQIPVLLNVDTGRPVSLKTPFHWEGSSILDAAITPDGRRGVFGTYAVAQVNQAPAKAKYVDRGFLAFWDLTTGKPLFPKHQPYVGNVDAVAITPDGLRALSAGGKEKGEITLWDLTTGHPIRQIGPQKGAISSHALAFFPDGRRAASGGQDQLVHVWNLDTGAELAAWSGHDKTISSLALSNDGRRLATGSYDGAVILRDAESGQILHRFTMPSDDTGARVAFDPEGNLVAAGSGHGGTPPKPGRLVVWNAETYAVIREDETPFTRHLAVAALPNGRILTSDSHGVRLWTPRPRNARPPTPKASRDTKPIDLLRPVNANTFKAGDWHIDNGVLLSPATPARFQFPTVPPWEYRLDMDVERVGKDTNYGFSLGILVDGRQTEIAVDKKDEKGEKFSGLEGYDGLAVFSSLKVHRGALLVPGRSSHFAVTVRRGAIDVTCDGTRVMDWKGETKRLIPYQRWAVRDTDKIFLGSDSEVKFQKITLTPLGAGSR